MTTDKPEGPRSLLRRLLRKADQINISAGGQQGTLTAEADSFLTRARSGTPLPDRGEVTALPTLPTAPTVAPVQSPIRPPAPPAAPVPPPVNPAQPRYKANIPQSVASPEDRLQAETTLLRLREQTAQVANEFAEGKLNRAQFLSLYAHYHDKVVIIERMLTRDPNTQAWQSVARPGHTSFLKQHFEARMLAFAVYDYGNLMPITVQGSAPFPSDIVTHMLEALEVVRHSRTDLKPISRKAGIAQFVVMVPGTYTVAVVLFSLEPAAYQIKNACDLHLDFERANRHALERGFRTSDQLVFPHRALLSERPEA